MKTLIIIPTYNEEENIEKIITQTQENLKGHFFSILIVDDNSKDNTRKIVKDLTLKYPNVHLFKRESKLGLASAYIDGFKYGIQNNFDVFIQMDADFSHNPKYLPNFFEKLKENDVVIASRNIKGGSVVGWGFSAYLKLPDKRLDGRI